LAAASASHSPHHALKDQSLLLVFSSVRSPQDTFKLMPLAKEETAALHRATAFLARAHA